MKFICPLIVVDSIERSRHFFESILGQTVKHDFGENVTFHGDFSIHLKTHFSRLIDNMEITSHSNSMELYFEEDSIEIIVEKLKEYGVTFIHEIREQPWRQKVVRFYDPDGNIIEIGETLEHLSYRLYLENISLSEISKITYMPEEFVIESINSFKE